MAEREKTARKVLLTFVKLKFISNRIIIKQIFTCESVSLPVPEQTLSVSVCAQFNSIPFDSIRFIRAIFIA